MVLVLVHGSGVCVLQVIDAISSSISSTHGVTLLDVDAGSSTNRTVFTFVGSPEAVVEGALNAARCAFNLIDMTRHSGQWSHDLQRVTAAVTPQSRDPLRFLSRRTPADRRPGRVSVHPGPERHHGRLRSLRRSLRPETGRPTARARYEETGNHDNQSNLELGLVK